jgi:hypothetical protein
MDEATDMSDLAAALGLDDLDLERMAAEEDADYRIIIPFTRVGLEMTLRMLDTFIEADAVEDPDELSDSQREATQWVATFLAGFRDSVAHFVGEPAKYIPPLTTLGDE